jgi:hypothetical protein
MLQIGHKCPEFPSNSQNNSKNGFHMPVIGEKEVQYVIAGGITKILMFISEISAILAAILDFSENMKITFISTTFF